MASTPPLKAAVPPQSPASQMATPVLFSPLFVSAPKPSGKHRRRSSGGAAVRSSPGVASVSSNTHHDGGVEESKSSLGGGSRGDVDGGGDSSSSYSSDDEPVPVTNVNITSVLENPRERLTLIEDIWSAEPAYVVPECAYPMYAAPPKRQDFEPYLRKLRKAARGDCHRLAWDGVPVPSSAAGGLRAASPLAAADPLGPKPAGPSSRAIVPALFFEDSFDLTDPDTFDEALGGTAALALQQKLSHYLDTVEDEISRHIRRRADDFVKALNTLQGLEANVGSACGTIGGLRSRLSTLRTSLATNSLERLGKQRRLERMRIVREKLVIIQRLTSAAQTVATLARQGSYLAALDAVDDADTIIQRDLDGLLAVAPIQRELRRHCKHIAQNMTSQFATGAMRLACVGADLSVDGTDVGDGRPSSPSSPSDSALHGALETTLRPVMEGLVRVGSLGAALEAYQKRLATSVEKILITNVVESLQSVAPAEIESRSSQQSSVVYRAMKNLTAPSFTLVMSLLQDSLLGLLKRVMAVHELTERVLDVAETGGSSSAPPVGPSSSSLRPAAGSDWRHQIERLRAVSSGVVAVADSAVRKGVCKLFESRRELHRRVKVAEMRAVCAQMLSFADTVGSITGVAAKSGALRLEVVQQAKEFTAALTEKHREALNRLLDSEQWRQISEVPIEVQQIADQISASHPGAAPGSSDGSPTRPSIGRDVRNGSSGRASAADSSAALLGPSAGATNHVDDSKPGGASAVDPSRRWTPRSVLVVSKQPYRIVNTMAMLMKMVGDFLSLAQAVPPVTSDVVNSLNALLSRFNNRSRKLVLEAGALKVAHLKMISTKHLAMCSQSLAAVVASLPCLRAAFAQLLPPLQHPLLSPLDVLVKAYNKHIDKIFAKILDIVMNLTDSCCRGSEEIDWNQLPTQIPSAMMSKLISGIATLHKQMKQLLRPDQVEALFCQIAVGMSSKIPVVFSQVPVSTLTNVGKDNLRSDVRHLLQALRRCHGLGKAGSQRTISPMEPGLEGVVAPSAGADVLTAGQAALESMDNWLVRQYGDAPAPLLPSASAPASTFTAEPSLAPPEAAALPTIDSFASASDPMSVADTVLPAAAVATTSMPLESSTPPLSAAATPPGPAPSPPPLPPPRSSSSTATPSGDSPAPPELNPGQASPSRPDSGVAGAAGAQSEYDRSLDVHPGLSPAFVADSAGGTVKASSSHPPVSASPLSPPPSAS